ncbi:MAG: trypsin-like peptidase domain-containing protein [Rhodanobacteraceae bacterium]|nr:trypsin-like peptidase domain-containing protein [Rhodanobacteraceae bacterium]
MTPTTAQAVAHDLKAGRFPVVSDWLLAKGAQLIVDEIQQGAVALGVQQARNAAARLNDNCYFELTRAIAKAWYGRKGFDPVLQKRRVQALINTTLLDEAQSMATEAIAVCEKHPGDIVYRRELLEFRGLLGRIAKQRYVNNTDDLDSLVDATNRYLAQYLSAPESYWHGINALACLNLELHQSGGIPRPALPDFNDLARKILETVVESCRSKPDPWAYATASEACLALGRCDDAELWLYRMLSSKDTTRFQLDSYSRQLREIWRGDPTSPVVCAGRLLSIIANFCAQRQARITLVPSQVPAIQAALANDERGLEKNFLGESSFSVDSIRSLLSAFRSVGCVMNDIGERLGTGFLLSGAWLKPVYGAGPVFLTNAHVISDTVTNAIPTGKARVTFELDTPVAGNLTRYAVSEVLFTSEPGPVGARNDELKMLDCTIVRLRDLPGDAPVLQATRDLPLLGPKARAFVAGHPRGAGLQIALHDSLLLDIDDQERLVHYRTPTDPGSSGSPVFNADWEVMALHHAGLAEAPRLNGEGTYEANEGVSMSAIRRRLRS